jgi:L-threonylcarbamoyladenylate synthase
MKTLNIRSIDCIRPQSDLIDDAIARLRKDGIIVAPTETRYGLLACIDSRPAVERIYALKKRKMSQPTAIFVRSVGDIFDMGFENNDARRLAEGCLPGPLTLILKNKSKLSSPVVVNNKIGFRYSSSPVISMLLEGAAFFLTATSANISGGIEAETIDEISAMFGTNIDLYLDGGPLKEPISTVVDCTGDRTRILRLGAISGAEIEKCLMDN